MNWDHTVPARISDRIGAPFAPRLLRVSIDRDRLYAGLFIIALVNGLAGRAKEGLSHRDLSEILAAALSVSAVVWFACFAALSLVLCKRSDDPVKTIDG